MSEQEEHDVVLGVVPEPENVQAVPVIETEYEATLRRVTEALQRVRDRLALLRKERAEINEEVRRLVEELELLERMSRVAPKPPKEGS